MIDGLPQPITDRDLAQLCSDSYRGNGALVRASHVVYRSDIAYALDMGDLTVIVVRGSDDRADWLSNADVRRDRSPLGGDVHHGFSYAAEGLFRLLDALHDLSTPGRRVILTGHSRGAALATLLADHMPRQNVIRIATFGSPRVGSKKWADGFAARFGHRTRRYVYQSDPVTLIPLPWFGWRHVGELQWITRRGDVRNRTNWLSWLWFSIRARRRIAGDGIADHAISHYVRATPAVI